MPDLTICLWFYVKFIPTILFFIDSSFKQDMNNVSFMTNKIELLTNSLSDPEMIGSSIGKLFVLMVLK